MSIVGRDRELSRLDAWLGLTDSEPGLARMLVLVGEAGIGKTTLWVEAVRRCRDRGWSAMTCRPSASEAPLSYVGLADLLRHSPELAFEQLPPPQRRPLEVALLRAEPGEADLEPRAVGTGLSALLATMASGQPLVLAIDDIQWLDTASARALAFAMRRLEDSPVRLLAALRIGDPLDRRAAKPLAMLEKELGPKSVERLEVGRLSVAALHQLFREQLGESFPRPTLVRIHRAASGNPFFALEIARELRRLPPGAGRPGEPLPIPEDQREVALLRLARLPRTIRDHLLVVAALSTPTATDLDPEALNEAERSGILVANDQGRLEFSHPLFGSALYSSVSDEQRRALHLDLSSRVQSLEERARHRALGSVGPDEEIAEMLDRAAEAAGARGAADAAVELKELARRLTPPADRQAVVRRDLELADRRYFAGDAMGARLELERSLGSLPPGEERARVLLELGSVQWTQNDATAGLERLSQALEEAETDELRARIHSRASAFAVDCDYALDHAQAALALLNEADDPVLYCFALHNMALWKLYAGGGADHEAVERGMRLQKDVAAWEMSTVPAMWARLFDDFDTARQRNEDLLRAFREQGDEASSCGIMAHLAGIETVTGHTGRARAYAEEALELATETEQETYVIVAAYALGQVEVQAGYLGAAQVAGEEILQKLAVQPDETLETMARALLGKVAVCRGDLEEADRQLSRADEIVQAEHCREPAADRFHPDHAEAVIALGDLERGELLVTRMEDRAAALPRPWILLVSARCRGLLNAAKGDVDAARDDYRRALGVERAAGMPVEYGRTVLALGRLHRRRRERQAARDRFEEALRIFGEAGAQGWEQTTHDEIRRVQPGRGSRTDLTPTEQEIAELAASGLRNEEIAARIFLSPKTVEKNLSRVYLKLGIRSRAQLGRLLPGRPCGRDVQT
jgi:DNA-binding CsgD family transcriptional regulator